MARSTVNHTCGHTSYVTGHNRRDADRRAEWAARAACWECEKQAATERAKQAADAAGLPSLTGSEKQIAYGESMRAAKLPLLSETLIKLRAQDAQNTYTPAALTELLDALILLEDEAVQNTSAKFWIEICAHGDWLGWLSTQLRQRNLAPTALAEANRPRDTGSV